MRALISPQKKRVSPRMAIGAWSSNAPCSSRCAASTISPPMSLSAALSKPVSVAYTVDLVCSERAQSITVSMIRLRWNLKSGLSTTVRSSRWLVRCMALALSPILTMRSRIVGGGGGGTSSGARLGCWSRPRFIAKQGHVRGRVSK